MKRSAAAAPGACFSIQSGITTVNARPRWRSARKGAAESQCGTGRVGLQTLSAVARSYQEARSGTTLLGAALTGALAQNVPHFCMSRPRFANRSPRM
jgi:hypothetical protein